MKLPNQDELKKYINLDFEKFLRMGHSPKEIASMVLDEYDFISHQDDFLKLVIYNEVQLYCIKNKITFAKLDIEIENLKNQLKNIIDKNDFLSQLMVSP